MNSLIIIGAGGHGKVAADIAVKLGYSDIKFLDDLRHGEYCLGFPIIGSTSDASKYQTSEFFVAVGDSKRRELIMKDLDRLGLHVINLIHPSSVIGSDVSIGKGTIVMAGAIINSGTRIGNGVIINTSASVDHDNKIGNYSHVSVGAHLAGSVTIGKSCWIGIGSVISNNLSICNNCYLGASSLVVKNLSEPGIYYGAPCLKKEKKNEDTYTGE